MWAWGHVATRLQPFDDQVRKHHKMAQKRPKKECQKHHKRDQWEKDHQEHHKEERPRGRLGWKGLEKEH